MRVYLTSSELQAAAGTQLLKLCRRIAYDGKLDLQEIITLRKWLRANQTNNSVAAIAYLHDIMERVTADRVIDRDEQLELQLAIERVIPPAHRTQAIQARQKREAERREQARIEKEREKKERQRMREEENARATRMRHEFAKVAGVSFPNDDGSERQEIIARCQVGEELMLQHDAHNEYSIVTTKVLRRNGEQIGHAPEYLAERIVDRSEEGYLASGVIANLTGGTFDKPTRGVNFAVFYIDRTVSSDELASYANNVLAGRPSYWSPRHDEMR
jgi:hypothetical protein